MRRASTEKPGQQADRIGEVDAIVSVYIQQPHIVGITGVSSSTWQRGRVTDIEVALKPEGVGDILTTILVQVARKLKAAGWLGRR